MHPDDQEKRVLPRIQNRYAEPEFLLQVCETADHPYSPCSVTILSKDSIQAGLVCKLSIISNLLPPCSKNSSSYSIPRSTVVSRQSATTAGLVIKTLLYPSSASS